MKLQSARIKSNDFPEEQKELADNLGGVLNPFIDKLVIGFNKNFTVEDNLPFEFKTLDITVTSAGLPSLNGGVSAQTLTIPTTLTNLKGYICVNVTDLSGGNNYPTHTPFVVFTLVNKTVTINKITGLTGSKPYRLVLLGVS